MEFINIYSTMLFTIIGAVLSIILYPVLNPLIETPIQKFLSKLFGSKSRRLFRTKTTLKGEWIQCWIVKGSKNFPEKNEATIKLYQFGKLIHGEAKHSKGSFIVRGTIENEKHLTGIWEDKVKGNTYSGSFQLYIHKYSNHMTGKWLGFSESNKIREGDWLWKRLNESDYKTTYSNG